MKPARQARFWFVGCVVFIAILWLLRDMLLPFVAGMVIAYFLDPVADRFERWGAPRWLATVLVLLIFVIALTFILLLILPAISAQIADLVANLPRYADWVRNRLVPLIGRILEDLSGDEGVKLPNIASDYAGSAVGWLGSVLRSIVSGGVALFDILSLMIVTPIVAFYLLRDWDRMTALIDSWLPLEHAETIREQVREVDHTLAGFIRGQATVCLILGVFYALGLSLVGLNFGLVIGLLAGFLSFVPYVGSVIGFVASVGIAIVQFGDPVMVGLVAAIFFVGQAVEGNFLTPKLVGGRIGLHPVWVIFALLAGASLFGFLGVLLAVPVAAVIGVLVRFALGRYLDSRFYTGGATAVATPVPPGVPQPSDPVMISTGQPMPHGVPGEARDP